MIDSKQEHYTSAISNARTAWLVVRMRDHSSELRATCKVRLGEALAGNGQYRRAVYSFRASFGLASREQSCKGETGCGKARRV
jgi:hypothetical protein